MRKQLAVAAASGALALTAIVSPAAAQEPTPSDGRAFGAAQAEEGMANGGGRGGFRRVLIGIR